jgi:tRNA(His) guanylyltransferase
MEMTMTNAKDSLGDRMKANYEDRGRHYLVRRTPVVIRVDGRAFHTLARGLDKPFDLSLGDAMMCAAAEVAEDMQGFKLGYVQSDEASFLLTDYVTLQTGAWFDYNKSKIETISASCMTAHFNRHFSRPHRLAMFDARAFNIPREEVANYFLWRAKDWERNSVSMYCGAYFSAKQMHGQGRADQHEMLHSVGKNWATDLPERWRNGTWLIRGENGVGFRHDILPVFADIDAVVSPLLQEATTNPPPRLNAALTPSCTGIGEPREV